MAAVRTVVNAGEELLLLLMVLLVREVFEVCSWKVARERGRHRHGVPVWLLWRLG